MTAAAASLPERAQSFLAGQPLPWAEANALADALMAGNQISLAREVTQHLRQPGSLTDAPAPPPAQGDRLCLQQAMLTSRDPELPANQRHQAALDGLAAHFGPLSQPALDGQAELLGIAAGIHKRRWQDLGQLADLHRAADLYRRAGLGGLGRDGYAQVNQAFVEHLLAELTNDPSRAVRANALREHTIAALAPADDWFNVASRAEALFGLRRFAEAAAVLRDAKAPPLAPWELQTTARQLGELVRLLQPGDAEMPAVRDFFEALTPGAGQAVSSMTLGKVGLALSGGGFRAAYYHLGVLARLAEHDALRHVDVLSCVSGGSVVGACWWLMLRRRLLDPCPLGTEDYRVLVRDLITHFNRAVDADLRGRVQPGPWKALWRLLRGARGAIDSQRVASALDELFFRPLMPAAPGGKAPLMMHELPFTPADHQPLPGETAGFNPGRHNWLREHKVPALVLNATTVNTGHAWQFTPTWMGESPWAVSDAADAVPRLEWAGYQPAAGWQVGLGQAVAASACVPFLFDPLRLDGVYAGGVQVQLVDGGVHDNQGTVALLAMNCNVVLVSDACGQLVYEPTVAPGLAGLLGFASRTMDTVMERTRQARHADLQARRDAGQLRRLMFLHIKAGLRAGVVARNAPAAPSADAPVAPPAPPLGAPLHSPSGVRRDFQQRLAELRTDLDRFEPDERNALMACGYQMAGHALDQAFAADRGLPPVCQLAAQCERPTWEWPFAERLRDITQEGPAGEPQARLLEALRAGSRVQWLR